MILPLHRVSEITIHFKARRGGAQHTEASRLRPPQAGGEAQGEGGGLGPLFFAAPEGPTKSPARTDVVRAGLEFVIGAFVTAPLAAELRRRESWDPTGVYGCPEKPSKGRSSPARRREAIDEAKTKDNHRAMRPGAKQASPKKRPSENATVAQGFQTPLRASSAARKRALAGPFS